MSVSRLDPKTSCEYFRVYMGSTRPHVNTSFRQSGRGTEHLVPTVTGADRTTLVSRTR